MNDLLSKLAKKPIEILVGIFAVSILLIWFSNSNYEGLDSKQRDEIRMANAYISTANEIKDEEIKARFNKKAKDLLDSFSAKDNSIYNTSLGFYYLVNNDLASSYEVLKKAWAKDKTSGESRYTLHYFKISALNLALNYVNNNKTDEAFAIAGELLPYDGQNAELFNLLGVCYIRKNDEGNAIAQFKKTLSLNPNHQQARQNLFSIYIQKYQSAIGSENFEYGLSIIKEAMKINVNNPELHLIAGELYLRLGDKQNAIDNFKKSAEINNNQKAKNYLLQLGVKN